MFSVLEIGIDFFVKDSNLNPPKGNTALRNIFIYIIRIRHFVYIKYIFYINPN